MAQNRTQPLVNCECCKKLTNVADVGIEVFQYKLNLGHDENKDQSNVNETLGPTNDITLIINFKDQHYPRIKIVEQNVTSCKKCEYLAALPEKLVQDFQTIQKDYVTQICSHCRAKQQANNIRTLCKEIINKYLVDTKRKDKRASFKTWKTESKTTLRRSSKVASDTSLLVSSFIHLTDDHPLENKYLFMKDDADKKKTDLQAIASSSELIKNVRDKQIQSREGKKRKLKDANTREIGKDKRRETSGGISKRQKGMVGEIKTIGGQESSKTKCQKDYKGKENVTEKTALKKADKLQPGETEKGKTDRSDKIMSDKTSSKEGKKIDSKLSSTGKQAQTGKDIKELAKKGKDRDSKLTPTGKQAQIGKDFKESSKVGKDSGKSYKEGSKGEKDKDSKVTTANKSEKGKDTFSRTDDTKAGKSDTKSKLAANDKADKTREKTTLKDKTDAKKADRDSKQTKIDKTTDKTKGKKSRKSDADLELGVRESSLLITAKKSADAKKLGLVTKVERSAQIGSNLPPKQQSKKNEGGRDKPADLKMDKIKMETFKSTMKFSIKTKTQKSSIDDLPDLPSDFEDSDQNLDNESLLNALKTKHEVREVIKGTKIVHTSESLTSLAPEPVPALFKTNFTILPELVLTEPTKDILKDRSTLSNIPFEMNQGSKVMRYALSDQSFVDNGWTVLPTEKVLRKLNIYKMRPSHPEYNWFKNNKNKSFVKYKTGERLAEIDPEGCGRWYYRNQKLALEYYEPTETNVNERYTVYSSGEPDSRGRNRPVTVLATFDSQGNGVVFDHKGRVRLKYNQSEGMVLDRELGPYTHWKWHSLNDPPALKHVMFETQLVNKDEYIYNLNGPDAKIKKRPPVEDAILAIEFENYIKEKAKSCHKRFEPYQIRMKAVQINEQFSLKIIDQKKIYLIFQDGDTHMKLNLGFVIDNQEIIGTETMDLGAISSTIDRPVKTDSVLSLQKCIKQARRYHTHQMEREERLFLSQKDNSADRLTQLLSKPLQTTLRIIPDLTIQGNQGACACE